MHSLFDALLAQHARQLTPVRCAHSTISQLHRYFEDVVLENNLSALVIESLPLAAKRSPREMARVRDLAQGGRRTFFFAGQSDDIQNVPEAADSEKNVAPVFLQVGIREQANEHFVVIADSRFSALLATVRTGNGDSVEDEVVWTFEPDIVYSALEYLMARVGAEHPYHASVFGNAVRSSMPKATSLQLTLSVTTKLAHLLQEQAGREIALNRIATAIRESLELGIILQKTVTEVGAALNVGCCALRVEGQTQVQALSYSYFADRESEAKLQRDEVMAELNEITERMASDPQLFMREGAEGSDTEPAQFPLVAIPLVFHEKFIGALEVVDDDPARTWQDNETLLLRTVANQVAVAINHADLYAQMQQQALTDALTGCYNRRSFEMQLERELQMATRLNQPLALLMLDLDRFKELNDSAGHDAGDDALRKLAECFRQELRAVDTAARFGGDEFALVLPQAYPEGAHIVAERLRRSIEKIEIPGAGHLTASIGIASFPLHAASRAGLVTAADTALYHAKRSGRNRVATFGEAGEETSATLLPPNQNISESIEHRDLLSI
ncbi:MAG TPA: sensor domain-containing diguanylate cyclase [Pyrinomonadaceae bacterium]|nr:sensor domain-containing diguanylate cyclase [Pyrinomonadaceae bacterium]